MKRFVCMLLILIFTFSGVALADNSSAEQTPAEADEYLENAEVRSTLETKDGLSFNIYDTFAGVSGCNDNMAFSVDIPDTVEGKPVKKIEDEAFANFVMLNSVSFPKDLVSIGARAFSACNLSYVELPESLRSIGESAFEGCSFRSIILPSGLEKIEDRAFSFCMMLKNVAIPVSVQSIGDDAFGYTGPLEIYYMGTKDQWESLVDDNARCGLSVAVFYFNEETVERVQPSKDSV